MPQRSSQTWRQKWPKWPHVPGFGTQINGRLHDLKWPNPREWHARCPIGQSACFPLLWRSWALRRFWWAFPRELFVSFVPVFPPSYCYRAQRFGRSDTARCSAPQSLKVVRCEKSSKAETERSKRPRPWLFTLYATLVSLAKYTQVFSKKYKIEHSMTR